MQHVTHTFDTPWISHQIEGSAGYEFIFNILGPEYTDAYNIDIARVAPGGYSPQHIDQDNHAFFIIEGEAEIQIADESHPVRAGSVVRIPRGVVHAIRNSGKGTLMLLSIYDPPRVRGKDNKPKTPMQLDSVS
jgi:mannose-6-phosphate isomerase-like protein (cupin superfamily)